MGKFEFKAVRIDAELSCPMCAGGKTTFFTRDSIIWKVVSPGLACNNNTTIKPFSAPQCTVTQTTCAPVLQGVWKFVAINAKQSEKPLLLDKSIIICKTGQGVLRIMDPKQIIVKIDLASVIANAIKRLKEMIDNRLNNEEDFNKYFDKWFGDVHSKEEKQKMRDRMIKMNNLLDKMVNRNGTLNENYFEFNNDDKKYNVFAYVYSNDANHVVTVCPETFSERNSTTFDTPAGVIGHECSHFDDIGGTDDFEYGLQNCLELTNTPEKAINNADSFEYFLEDNTP
ncbi:hypothetical protein HMPREF0971_03239 [Segatella oris F0302]|uniref:Lysine-specific metallo-endopeptidase domain-containing protein n=1 Tax=Segatella oris F0302 TaxID=649760 RepID=D1QW44_9BACT|nr:M35 family metallo-endopeptidase [Segatella oris]EFB30443.1 hypothetical protein HMPREF0971_03239 [Segatella oris F0302]